MYCCCSAAQSFLTLFATPWTIASPGSSVHGISQQEYWSAWKSPCKDWKGELPQLWVQTTPLFSVNSWIFLPLFPTSSLLPPLSYIHSDSVQTELKSWFVNCFCFSIWQLNEIWAVLVSTSVLLLAVQTPVTKVKYTRRLKVKKEIGDQIKHPERGKCPSQICHPYL